MRKNNQGRRKTGKTMKAFIRFLASIKKYRGWIVFSVILLLFPLLLYMAAVLPWLLYVVSVLFIILL